jgi:hypothetical protein
MLTTAIDLITKFKEIGKGVGFVLLIGMGMCLAYALAKSLNIEFVQTGTFIRYMDLEKSHIPKEQFSALKKDLESTKSQLKLAQRELQEALRKKHESETKLTELNEIKSEIKVTTDLIDELYKDFYKGKLESEKVIINSKIRQLYEQRKNLEERATILTKSL